MRARLSRKGRKYSPLYVVSRFGTFNKIISIGIDSRRENCYCIIKDGEVKKRIYKLGNGWYIWDEKLSYRVEIESFTLALKVVERELMCEA